MLSSSTQGNLKNLATHGLCALAWNIIWYTIGAMIKAALFTVPLCLHTNSSDSLSGKCEVHHYPECHWDLWLAHIIRDLHLPILQVRSCLAPIARWWTSFPSAPPRTRERSGGADRRSGRRRGSAAAIILSSVDPSPPPQHSDFSLPSCRTCTSKWNLF